jgi:hypothetical protein
MAEARERRIQVRISVEEESQLDELAAELHTTKHNVAALSLSAGLRAFRQAVHFDHASLAILPMFTPRSDDPEEWSAFAEAHKLSRLEDSDADEP